MSNNSDTAVNLGISSAKPDEIIEEVTTKRVLTPETPKASATEPSREVECVAKLFEASPQVHTPKIPTPEELWVDPEKLATGTSVKKIITVIPIRKPEAHEYFRTHPDPIWERPLVVVENKIEKRDALYIVTPGIVPSLGELGIKYRMVYLFPTLTLQQAFFLTPVTVPEWDGRKNDWSTTGYDAAQLAKTTWIKRVSGDGMYKLFGAEGQHPEPKWLENMTPEYLYGIAFRDGRIIDHLEHPVIKQLRGAAAVE
jgi:hypothetical protein